MVFLYFLIEPAETLNLPEDYVQKVKEIHEKGGYDSLGYDIYIYIKIINY